MTPVTREVPEDLLDALDEIDARSAWEALPAKKQAGFIRWLNAAYADVRPARRYDIAWRVKGGRSYPRRRTRWPFVDKVWESAKAVADEVANW